ncbi:hypothetical protein S40288_08090 [Stachybotrys chartarum IBT 40288]|nr:hypothetical protein S40288_08090 [Stachybotrys chartarum IBT 40288]
MASLESTLFDTATAYMQVFTTLEPDTITSIQTDDYEHTFAPASLSLPGPYNREQYAAHITSLRGFLRSFPVRFRRVWPNTTQRQVLIWAESEAEFLDSIKETATQEDWTFHGEYMWLLTMNESGDKVKQVLEFLDSKKAEQMRALIFKAIDKKKDLEDKDP